MKLSRKLAALAMAVLLAVSLTACSPKQVAQDMVVHLVHKLGLVEESDEDNTDTTTKAPAGGSVEFPAEMDTTAARVVTSCDEILAGGGVVQPASSTLMVAD